MKRRIVWGLAFLVLGSCSLQPVSPTLTLRLAAPGGGLGPLRRPEYANLSCVLVRVQSQGTPNSLTSPDVRNRSLDCLGLTGTLADTVTPTALLQGVQLNLASGTQTTLEVFGINSTLGSCTGKSLKAILAAEDPEIYRLAYFQGSVAQGDKVSVASRYDPATAVDIRASCFNVTDYFVPTPPASPLWQFGYHSLSGASLSFTALDHAAPTNYQAAATLDHYPQIDYNGTNQTINTGTVIQKPFSLVTHPGRNGEFFVLRYTVPCTGSYSLSAYWEPADINHGTTDVHLTVNGLSKFDGIVDPSISPRYPETETQLAKGDIVEFTTGVGSDGNFLSDSTRVVPGVSPHTVCR